MRGWLGATGLVDADDLERAIRSARLPASDKVTANAAETVDRNLDLVLSDDRVVDGSLKTKRNACVGRWSVVEIGGRE